MANKRVQNITRIALMAALISVVSPFSIPIGTIPVTLSLFVIMLSAVILPPFSALCSVIFYILLGMVGLPVFSGGAAGLAVLTGPTGGYIFGYIPLVLIISLLFIPIEKSSLKPAIKYILYYSVCIFSVCVCYVLGTLQFVLLTNMPLKKALAVCVIPFIPFDAAKAFLAVLLGTKVRIILQKNNLR